jgi:glycosyltransferase involved in cell wall biosynthesis
MQARDGQARSLWLDVGTLAGWRRPPTGIARTLQQLLRHWPADARLPLRLCCYDGIRGLFQTVEPAQVCPANPAGSAHPPEPAPPARSPWPAWRAPALPADLREACWHFGQAARHTGRLGRDLFRKGIRAGRKLLARLQRPVPGALFGAGDVLLIAGTSWQDGPPAEVFQSLRRVRGVRVAHLVYDITPLRHPHLCDPGLTRAVANWLPGVLANSDLVLTISEHSRRDLVEYGLREGLALPPVEKVRLGDEPGDEEGESAPGELLARAPGPFVLYVSTLGLNKNQAMLLQVWRRLIDRHGGGVPTLVLAGQPGWRAELLLRELRADAALSRHVVHLPKAGDRQLRWLYRRCLFTLFPSHYEGWGLPVAEALALGKCCIASSAASLPEVGGKLVDYHDPLDGPECLRLVEKALLEPGWLASREERLRREYRATSWGECARRVYEILGGEGEVRAAASKRAA